MSAQERYSRGAYLAKRGVRPPESEQERRERQRAEESGPYVDTKTAAEFLGLSESFLNQARHFGRGPPYALFGRAVRYDRAALTAWAAGRTVASARDEGAGGAA